MGRTEAHARLPSIVRRLARCINGGPVGEVSQGYFTMHKIIYLTLSAASVLAASTPARSDAVAVIDPKSAAEFVLKTCLPAMDDLANVEMMARENNWFPLPYIPSNSRSVTSRSRWRANGFFVATWIWIDGNLPSCFVGLLPYKKTNRDGFFDAISASVELKLISDRTLPRLRQETYEIIGEWPAKLKLLFSSTDDGTVSGASIYMDMPTAPDAPPDR